MKTVSKLTVSLICCFCLCTCLFGKASEDGKGNDQESRLLQHLLSMDGKELVNLRLTIERIENMSPEERAKLREQIGKMRKMDPDRIKSMRERYQSIPEETRREMRQRWVSMSTEERAEWRKKLAEMTPEERAALFEKEGFMPVNRKHQKKENGQGPPKKRGGERQGSPREREAE
ncbi:MAG: DUF3106 domain-containing protein [Lentimonas sp.]